MVYHLLVHMYTRIYIYYCLYQFIVCKCTKYAKYMACIMMIM